MAGTIGGNAVLRHYQALRAGGELCDVDALVPVCEPDCDPEVCWYPLPARSTTRGSAAGLVSMLQYFLQIIAAPVWIG